MNQFQKTLHEYADAIRDYKFIAELNDIPNYANDQRISLEGAFSDLARPYKGEKNRPYDTAYRTIDKKTTQNNDPIRDLLRYCLPSRLSWTEAERKAKPPQYSAGEKPEMYSAILDSVARFIIGTLGGCALIVSMVVMALNPSLTKSLIVVSVAVVLFALCVGLIFNTDNKETITATATYAAVLVVFVGTSGSGSGG